MSGYVALFRGINVGGHNSLPMQALRDLLANLGCEDVRTYIQSGNAVFRSAKSAVELAAAITNSIEQRAGFAPRVLLLSVANFKAIAAANPYREAEADPKSLHVCFLGEQPDGPDLDALNAVKTASESFALGTGALYLHTPDGIGRSRLAGRVEKCLGVEATARNWRTVCRILELAETVVS